MARGQTQNPLHSEDIPYRSGPSADKAVIVYPNEARTTMISRHLLIPICLSWGLAVAGATPGGHGAPPEINRPYAHPDIRRWVQIFERPGRELFDYRHQIVEASGVGPGMVVADIGAGTGLFTRLFAQAVGPQGRVIAVDISADFIDNILRQARSAGMNNVAGVVNAPDQVGLADGSVDIAFVAASYHHFEHPRAMLASIYRALRPGGALLVIDFRRIPGYSSPWVIDHVRANQETVVHEIEVAGFEFQGARDLLPRNYFLHFTRPSPDSSPHPGSFDPEGPRPGPPPGARP